MSARRHEAISQGTEVFHGEVPSRAAAVCARSTRAEHGAASEVVRVRAPAPREAEDQADLWAQRAPVPEHVRAREPRCRASPATTCWRRSRAAWTIWYIGWGSRRAAKPARQLIRHRHVEVKRTLRRHPELSGSTWRRGADPPEVARAGVDHHSAWISRRAVRRSRGSRSTARSFSGRMLERPQRGSIPIAAQEQLVVELYSK